MRESLQESFAFMLGDDKTPPMRPPFEQKEIFRLAAQGIYFGTSSWKYRGWEGMIYKGGYASEAHFQKQSLREYADYFPCVGIDFTFYTWPLPEMMAYLLDATPEHFRMFPKVTKRITMREFPPHASYGKWAGQKNPDFLNAQMYSEQFWEPISKLGPRIGALIFEMTNLSNNDLPQLERFFASIPHEVPLAIEVRSPEILSVEFYRRLRHSGVSPAFNFWTKMPLVREQWRQYLAAGGDQDTNPLLVRALLKPGRTYESAVQQFQPYNRLQDPFPEAHQDIAQIIQMAKLKRRKVYVLVNNRLEGSAPHSIGQIMQLV